MKNSLFLLSLLISLTGFSQTDTATWLWAQRAGGTGGGSAGAFLADQTRDIALDNEGNAYVVGVIYQSGFATFDTMSVPTYGDRDIFIAKYSCDGELEWVKTGGTKDNETSELKVAVDTIRKKVYMIGSGFRSHIMRSFKFATDTIFYDDLEGMFVWQFEYDGTLNYPKIYNKNIGKIYDYELDENGNIHLIFGSDTGTIAPGFAITTAGVHHLIINPNGDIIDLSTVWDVTSVNSSGFFGLSDVDRDEQGNYYMSGGFADSVFIGGTLYVSSGFGDASIIKYDSQGQVEWVIHERADTGMYDHIGFVEIEVISEDVFYVAAFGQGHFTIGSMKFGGGDTPLVLKNDHGQWTLVAQLTNVPTPDSRFRQLSYTKNRNLIITGEIRGGGTFNGVNLIDIGTGPTNEIFLAKLDENHNLDFVHTIPGQGDDGITALTLGHNENIYVGGRFGIDLQFPFDTLWSNGAPAEIFVAKFAIPQCSDTTSPWIGIEDVLGSENQPLLLYPNPTKGQFTIEAELDSPDAILTVYNSVGQIVHQKTIQQAGLYYKENIDLNLESGIYLVRLDAGSNTYTQKLILK